MSNKVVNVAGPLINEPAVNEPMVPLLEKKFVELAVWAMYKSEEVAETAVRVPKLPLVPKMLVPKVEVVVAAPRLEKVLKSLVEKKLVVVACVPVAFTKVKF